MKYRTLGDSGLEVSALGFGGWPLGGARYGSLGLFCQGSGANGGCAVNWGS